MKGPERKGGSKVRTAHNLGSGNTKDVLDSGVDE